MDNKTETFEGLDWLVEIEDVRNISVIENVCAVSPSSSGGEKEQLYV